MAKAKKPRQADIGEIGKTVMGPPQPVVKLHGIERLRVILNLSQGVSMTQLCEDAATEIENLRAAPEGRSSRLRLKSNRMV